MKGTDFDNIKRRDLAAQAFCLSMLNTNRTYLDTIKNSDVMIKKILTAVDTYFYNKKLGVIMYTTPIANNNQAVSFAGRMGILPSGCSENGERGYFCEHGPWKRGAHEQEEGKGRI